jgi:L-amino acid N-acyltransferase
MSHADIRFIDCSRAGQGDAILDILNHAIVHSTALYDYVPRPPQAMDSWFQVKQAAGFPVIGAVDGAGTLLGFASWGTFRNFPAYKYTVEHSVYVHHAQRGRGLGRALLQQVIARARAAEVHTLVGCIDAANTGSIALHTSLGFVHAGTVREAGFKFGRWLDAAFYQLLLDTPQQPVDG